MRKRMRNQGTKNIAKNMARISRIQPYLMRTYIYHSMRRDIFGDSFESLSNLNNDSSDVARGEKSKG